MTTASVETTRTQSGAFVFTISAVSALAGLLFGYDTGVISGAILFVQEDFRLATFQEEVVVSAVLLGCLIGAAFSGRLADRFGRRSVLIQVACLFILGALGTAFATGSVWLSIGRVIVGIAIGIASYTAPLYISEISPAGIRGKLVSLNQLMITIGILVSYLADYGLAASRLAMDVRPCRDPGSDSANRPCLRAGKPALVRERAHARARQRSALENT